MSDRAAVPSWVIDGWYANNPEKQQLAIARYFTPVTTPAERELARLPNCSAHLPTFACMDCGKFAFSKPTLCYWCARGGDDARLS